MAFDEDQKKCGGITTFGLFTLLLSIAMIVIGVLNLDLEADDPIESGTCRAQIHIPVFLIGGGVIMILSLVLRFLFQRCCRKCGECGSDDKLCSSLNFACKFSCILLYDVLAAIVFLAWLIIGTNWTMPIYDTVEYEGSSSNFCPEYLYLFTFVTIIVLWIIFILSITCGLLAKFCQCFYDILCCKPCKRADQNQAV